MMISIIVGSMRQASQSAKVASYLAQQLKQISALLEVRTVDLHDLDLPLWNEKHFQNNQVWPKISETLKKSSAVIVITPEWDGMASPALKNLFNYCRNLELYHKPALLIAVSAGQGGSYPIAELRMSSYKNSRICYLPEHVLVRHVEEVLNHEAAINENDRLIRERLNYALKVLIVYEGAFKTIRQQDFLYHSNFQNGM